MPVFPPKPPRNLLRAVLVVLACLAIPEPAQAIQSPSSAPPAVICPSWKPVWQTTPLPNGRALPYLLIPLDSASFRGCDAIPVLAGGLPVVRLFITSPGGGWQELALAREVAGLPYPAPPTARVFWQEPADGFPHGTHMAVYLMVQKMSPSGIAGAASDEWLRYEMPGAVPTIDRSALGPVEVSGSANYVPNQLLLTGATAAAYHGGVRIVLPSLSANPQGDQVYLRSDNLLSTQNLDESAGYRLAFGVQHNLPSNEWDISPNDSAEIWGRSNQATTDQSIGVSAGSLVLGRDWRGPIGNRFLYAAVTPRLQLYPLQGADLVRRDMRLDPGFTERNYYDPSAELILAPFFLGLRPGQTATLVRNANLSFDVKGWYVTGLGPEYRYVVRLQLPIRIWILQDVGISYFQGADENSYFRYSNGVGFDASVRRF